MSKSLKYGNILFLVITLILLISYPGEALVSNVVAGDYQLIELVTDAEKNDGEENIIEEASKILIPFIANNGQIGNESVKFYARTFSGTVYVTKDGELVYSLPKFEGEMDNKDKEIFEARDKSSLPAITKGWALKERFLFAQSNEPQGITAAQTRVNYFIGNDKSKWQNNIATYNTVSFGEVYPGISLSLNARGNNVEKIFAVNPGADVEQIKIKLEGANSLMISDQGELEINTGLGTVLFTKPVAYQEKDGKKEYVQVAYRLEHDYYGFTVGDEDVKRFV